MKINSKQLLLLSSFIFLIFSPQHGFGSTASDYESHSWTCGETNTGTVQGATCYNKYTSEDPCWFTAGQSYTGVAYSWGHWDKINSFTAKLDLRDGSCESCKI